MKSNFVSFTVPAYGNHPATKMTVNRDKILYLSFTDWSKNLFPPDNAVILYLEGGDSGGTIIRMPYEDLCKALGIDVDENN